MCKFLWELWHRWASFTGADVWFVCLAKLWNVLWSQWYIKSVWMLFSFNHAFWEGKCVCVRGKCIRKLFPLGLKLIVWVSTEFPVVRCCCEVALDHESCFFFVQSQLLLLMKISLTWLRQRCLWMGCPGISAGRPYAPYLEAGSSAVACCILSPVSLPYFMPVF